MTLKKHHYGILAITLLLLGVLAGYSLFKNSIIPVAWVKGDLIFLHEVQQNSEISQKLYAQAPSLVTGQDRELAALFESKNTEALFGRALEGAIVSSIVRSHASSQVLQEAERLTLQSLSEGDITILSQALGEQYEWDIETFKKRVIEPQVVKQLLAQEYGEEYDAWLARSRRETKARIWFVPFDWRNGELVEL